MTEYVDMTRLGDTVRREVVVRSGCSIGKTRVLAIDSPPPFRYLTNAEALARGYSLDRRRRRGQHRRAARSLRSQGGGGIIRTVVAWHLQQARRP